jgi:putative hydrolase of the HAD superfamily
MTIKAVLFDLDDTLLWDERSVKEAFHATCAEAAKEYDMDPAQLEGAVRSEARKLYESFATYPFTLNIGINPFEALWANFNDENDDNFRALKELAPEYRTQAWTLGLKSIGIDDTQLGNRLGELFPAERRSRPILYEETYQVLEDLKGKVRLLLLTNGSPDLQHEKLAAVPKLAPYFDHIMVSGGFGEGKPSPAIFRHCMDLLGIEANEGIMVGDKLTTDIKGALSVGMKAVWINRRELKRSDEIIPDYEIEELNELFPIIELL